MVQNTENALHDYAIRLGDDALVLGHRLSEWCSNGPFLEEDLALTNVALDLIGRARMFYTYAAELADDGSTEDSYAFTRDCREFRNRMVYELPRGDFAFSTARQYFVDEFAYAFMLALENSSDERFAAIAAKSVKESRYHLRRSREWMLRLGDGTDESHQKLQLAVDELWGFLPEMFEVDEVDDSLLQTGVAVDLTKLKEDWELNVACTLREATISMPEGSWQVSGGRQGIHTEHLGHILSELQFMQRAYPGLNW